DQDAFPVQYLGANVPQAWAAGAVVQLLETMIGLEPDAANQSLTLCPALPPWLTSVVIEGLTIGTAEANLVVHRNPDGTHSVDVTQLVAQPVAGFGGLDLLVDNAGTEQKIPLLKMSLADWNAVINTNLTGAFLCLRESAQMMRDGGVIINIASVHEFIPWPGFAHYCTSKAGLKLLMQTAAREL